MLGVPLYGLLAALVIITTAFVFSFNVDSDLPTPMGLGNGTYAMVLNNTDGSYTQEWTDASALGGGATTDSCATGWVRVGFVGTTPVTATDDEIFDPMAGSAPTDLNGGEGTIGLTVDENLNYVITGYTGSFLLINELGTVGPCGNFIYTSTSSSASTGTGSTISLSSSEWRSTDDITHIRFQMACTGTQSTTVKFKFYIATPCVPGSVG